MNHRRNAQLAALFAIACATLLMIASRGLGLSWDESIYFEYADGLRQWARDGFSLNPHALVSAWHWKPAFNPHPPFLKMLSALSASVGGPFPLSYRLGPIFLISGFFGLSFFLLAAELGAVSAGAALFFVLLQPRPFTELLIATSDGALVAGWLLMCLLGWRIARTGGSRALWATFFAVHAMLTASKITGFLSILPVLLYHALRRDSRSLLLTASAIPVSLAFLTLFAPGFWPAPWEAPLAFLMYPFVRSHSVSVATYYLGSIYGENLPWHAFLLLTVSTLPPLLIPLLAISPLARKHAQARSLLFAILPFLAFWLAIGFLPKAPKHDGVRQFVALFPFLGLLAWLGADALRRRWERFAWSRWIPAAALLWNAATLVLVHPFEQSYYNFLLGGLPGAEKAGMEVAHDFTPIDQDAINWLNRELPRGATLTIQPGWQPLLMTYQAHGLLRPDFRIPADANAPYDARILLHRKGMVPEAGYQSANPAFERKAEGVSVLKIARRP